MSNSIPTIRWKKLPSDWHDLNSTVYFSLGKTTGLYECREELIDDLIHRQRRPRTIYIISRLMTYKGITKAVQFVQPLEDCLCIKKPAKI